ncbi:DinB family protein [Mesorhizobium sp.]|uniref:DinB family protein n=1 Tax=Mesorhizobium sp. TaxID=1871066 RepID=UPI00122826A4|nr:DinB family protein [Mesorhizobium sp.]TIO07541.1 MAG: damage-inducible protein DinB [Mesorhizobium sp.]TIO31935.1 MAG: damage-inducible protein DinB [Mesorhizobium sp.]TIP10243.1 MAG: damage-inducible protein DinB [Mesorhizobium sp.]
MSTLALLRSLFAYQAWANDELLEKLASLDARVHDKERHAAMRLINHCHVVSRIFSAHLLGASHGYCADNTDETPALGELRAAVTATDRWYLDYLETVSSQQLSEPVAFVFTDGDKALMSRQEMLTHVVLHGGYHRGEVGRILAQISITPPWDTFAVHLHRAEPSRRLQMRHEPLRA